MFTRTKVLALGVITLMSLGFAGSAFAASTPTLGAAATYAVLGGTYTNTWTATTINGDVGFTTGPAALPLGIHTNYGPSDPAPTARTDAANALSTGLASQARTYTFADGAVNLSTDTGHGTAGVYTPGVYCTAALSAASITAGITLNGPGTFIFRINGALTSADNSNVTLNGVSANDVFWTTTAATILGATSHFEGTIIDNANAITVGANTTWTGRALSLGAGVVTTGDMVTISATASTPICSGTIGTSVFVSKSGSDSNNGSETCPFATIQAAINANTTVSGDTINVAAGTYYEQVIIDKAISVLGAGAATTFIDGTGVTPVQSGLINITNETGAVTLDGFTIRNAPAKGGTRIAIWARQADEGPVYSSSMTITHNILVGSGLVFTNDYGLYSNHNKSNLVFSYNDVSNFGGNALLFELHTGPAEISHNNITVYPSGPTAIFSMSYKDGYSNNNDVTGKQWLHDNTVNANGGSAIVMASAYGANAYNERTNGTYSNVEIADNTITNVGDASKGIQLEVDGDNGGFVNPLITGNTISAKELSPGSGLSRGIRIMGVVTGAQILDNVFTGFYRGIYQSGTWGQPLYPTNTQISTNTITGGTYGIDIAGGTATIHHNSIIGNTLFGVNNQTVATIDATNNWWGDASGPGVVGPGTGDKISTNITFDPWYIDAGMNTLSNAPVVPPTPPTNHGGHRRNINAATPAVPGVSPAIPSINSGRVLGAETIDQTAINARIVVIKAQLADLIRQLIILLQVQIDAQR